MKFILLLISAVSMFLAFGNYIGAALTWNYYPSHGINKLSYQYNSLLVILYVGIGLFSLCCWPYHKNRKLMIGIIITFLGSIFLHMGLDQIKIEKETTVTIDDSSYRVSSFEFPTVNDIPPYGQSPFRIPASLKNGETEFSSLYFIPKQQFDFKTTFETESAEKFFIAIYAAHEDNLDEYFKSKNLSPISHQKYGFEVYPETSFEAADSQQKFNAFIEKNLPMIEQDIAARTVVASNAP